jgi:acetyl esterase/lipase
MTTATLEARTHDFDVADVEYLRHGDKPLLARVFKPRGEGPYPALVEVHGGAWCLSDRVSERLRHEAMASHGIVSIALDFRSGNEDPYPASVQDVNYAVRWAKLRARELGTRADLIGLSGQSSGGHLAMLVAMRPHDPRYAAIPLPAGAPVHDARVRRHVVAGDQPVQPLPDGETRAGRGEPAGMVEVHRGAPGRLLAERSQHGGG